MQTHAIGQQVKALRGRLNTMNPERQFVGRVGTIVKAFPPVGGCEPYYEVAFSRWQQDYIDHCNLEVVP